MPDEANICLACFKPTENKKLMQVQVDRKAKMLKIGVMCILPLLGAGVIAFSGYSIAHQMESRSLPKLEKAPVTAQVPQEPSTSPSDKLFGLSTQETSTEKETPSEESLLGKLFGKDKKEDSSPSDQDRETNSSYDDVTDKTAVSHTALQVYGETTSAQASSSYKGKKPSPTVDSSAPATVTEAPVPEEVYFETKLTSNEKYVIITKYQGNAKNLKIPAEIDGKYVVEIAKGAIADDSKIESISFLDNSARPYFILDSDCISNLSRLTRISLPDTDLGITNGFAVNCLRLKEIDVDNWQFVFQDGGLYYCNSYDEWALRFICPAGMGKTLNLPSWCIGIEGACNLNEAVSLQYINLHKDCKSFPNSYNIPPSLKEINVENGNTKAFSQNGVMFAKDSQGSYSLSVYPPENPQKEFHIPENTRLTLNGNKYTNKYLETIYIPKSSSFDNQDAVFFRTYFKSLKTIYIENGHTLAEEAKRTFTGTVVVY